jgi:putative heme-binding domain-containing protein
VPDLVALVALVALASLSQAPQLLDDRFELPAGFHIYRAAGPEVTGGSYDIAFDAEGRLLCGDGERVRRLSDKDGDGVYDGFEVIASGLGPRGPQGLLVWGDKLFAVGGDGVQLFEGYRSGGPLDHRGRLGERFNTGGDHDAHTVLRGLDGWLYFISGDGGGTKDRRHITEPSSPALFERSCSVFRFSPDGKRWECIGSGGRNAPNLGINYLGELFSLDSDMEWHVDLPWWRPVRLHHWIAGGDQGWQDVGAYPPYYLDCLPGIHDVGRGSPDWGVFYEHTQFPERYRDAYFVCDYLSKSATTGGYNTSGRLFAFVLERDGAGWRASAEVFARPKPGARDAAGRSISFAVVDVEVAPDGSVIVSDHNQGLWRIVYAANEPSPQGAVPSIVPAPRPLPSTPRDLAAEALSLPQPGAEWTRAREEEIRTACGPSFDSLIEETSLAAREPLPKRLRAVRLLAPSFERLALSFLERLAGAAEAELRGQAAWLLGLRNREDGVPLLRRLLGDADPFVRRRAAEALCRIPSPAANDDLIARLSDASRLVRYAAMVALSHRPTQSWFEAAAGKPALQTRMRALVAAKLRREPPPAAQVRDVIASLLDRASRSDSKEERLDLLRVLGIFRAEVRDSTELSSRVVRLLVTAFPDPDADLSFEQARLLGEYQVAEAFGPLLAELDREKDPVRQFHLAQALSRLPRGWTDGEAERLVRWLLGTQRGWFAQPDGKGLQFPHFWATVLADCGERHGERLAARLAEVDLASQLGGVVLERIAARPGAHEVLIALYRASADGAERDRITRALSRTSHAKVGALLRDEYLRLPQPERRGAILRALASQPREDLNLSLFEEGLLDRDPDTVSACARKLAEYRPVLSEKLARSLLSRLEDRREAFLAVAGALEALSGASPPSEALARGPEGENREARSQRRERAFGFWTGWYAKVFGKEFARDAGEAVGEKSDEELRRFILSAESRGGDAARGRKVYELVRCASCHGGLPGASKEGQIFGPELAGVASRLTREELADAIVLPSKQVADRFKGFVVVLRNGAILTGFVTERSDASLVLVDPERVHRVPLAEVAAEAPQEGSLMPERLLSRLSWDEVRDFLAFLEGMAAPAPAPPAPASPAPNPQDSGPPGGKQAADLRARHAAGQTLLTWSEVEPPVTAETVSVVELRKTKAAVERERKLRYRIYRSPRPITSLDGLTLIAEVPPLTCWNTDYYGIDPRPEHEARRYVVADGEPPVAPDTGIYAHNPAEEGEAYYAVTFVRDGLEETALSAANATASPLREVVGPGEPVLQRVERPREANYVEDPELHYFVRWEAPPRSNVPSRPFDYRVGIPPRLAKPAPLGVHLHCWGANLDGGYIWWYKAADGAILVSSNQVPYDWWVGYHEKLGVAADWREKRDGVVRDYTARRLFAFVDWVAGRWDVDRSRLFVTGASMGGSGAAMLAVRYPERFAYALSSVGVHIAAKSPQFRGSYEAVCGPAGAGILHESGLGAFEYLDSAFLVRRDPPASLPFISFANGKNDAGIGWAQALEFARALQAARQPHIFTWGQAGHGERVYVPTPDGGGDGGPGLKNYLDLRLDQSLPAFSGCSLDDEPGSGEPADGATKGQLNLYLRWDTRDLVDEPERYELTAYLIDAAPRDECTVDITPRRLQRLRVRPGDRFAWTSTPLAGGSAQSGEAFADRDGLVTLEDVVVAKGRSRVHLERTGGNSGTARALVARPRSFPHRIWAACDFEARLPDYAWFGPPVTTDIPAYPGNATVLGVGERPYRDHAALMTGINPVPGPCMGKENYLYLRYRLQSATEATFQHFSLSSEDNNHVRVTDLTEGKWSEATMNFSRDARRNDGTPGVPFQEWERMDDLKVFVGKPGDGKDYDLLIDDVVFFSEDPALPAESEPFPNRVIFLAAFDTGVSPAERPKYWPGEFELVLKGAPPGTYRGAARVVPHAATRGKWIRLQVAPPKPVGEHTKLRFRYHLKGATALTVQVFDLTDMDNRHVRLEGLKQGEWAFAYADFTKDGKRNDGSESPFAAGHKVDDLFFFVEAGADLLVDEVCLFDAGKR